MDEEARSQIHLRNQIEKVSKKISEINVTKANWMIVHPYWYTDPESPLYEYFNEECNWIDKSIASAIDEEFWNLLDGPDE